MSQNWLEQVHFDSNGLIPAIAQDHQSGKVLMVAWMNAEALAETVASGRAVYWSRSRQTLWRKGEESGHFQTIQDIRLDCDADVLLLSVVRHGDIACHTGRQSCFYSRLNTTGNAPQWEITDPVLKDPDSIYSWTQILF